MSYQIVNFITKEPVYPTSLVFTGYDTPWEIIIDLEQVKKRISREYFKQTPPCLAKYLPFLPIKDYSDFVSLEEAATPLVQSKTLGKKRDIDLFFKMESKNPTGSFKDRGSAVEITVAKELNAEAIILASTGNMAASCACYAATAKIPCFVFVPENVPMAKLAQVVAFGGKIIKVRGTYNDAARLAKSIAERLNFYLAGDYAFRLEGQKTAAFELIDQLHFQVPDMVIVPIGCGTNIAAYAKGFNEYLAVGFIKTVPQLIGVEAEGAAAVFNSFKEHLSGITALERVETIASAIAIGFPLDGIKALDAIYSTNGQAITVTDKEILQAQHLLSTQEGLFVESSAAATFAALEKISNQQDLKGKHIVCILTGDGLKDPYQILQMGMTPITIHPKEEDFISLYKKNYFT